MLNDLQIPKSQLPSFISCLSLVSKSRHMYVGGGYRGTCTVIRAKGYSSKPEFRTSDLPLLQPECCSRTPPSSPAYCSAVADYNANSPSFEGALQVEKGISSSYLSRRTLFSQFDPLKERRTSFATCTYLGPLIDRISSCSIMA